MNFLNKIFKLHILFFVFSHIIYSMENRTFSVLLKSLKNTYDGDKIKYLRNLSSETYTCDQAIKILKTFNYSGDRVKGLAVISNRIEDTQNKGIIAEAFENDYSGDQAKAYKIINNIQSNNFSPPKAKFQHPPKKFTPPDNSRSNSSIQLEKIVNKCGFWLDYGLRDEVKFNFKGNNEIGTSNLYLWISYCATMEENTCRSPYIKKRYDVYPNWTGFQDTESSTVYQILTDNGNVQLPDYSIFNFAIIIKDELIAKQMIKVDKTCR